MKFDINNYKGNYVMHCKTEEEAREFCDYMHSIGRKWIDGTSYNKRNCWNKCKTDTCYNFNGDSYLSKTCYEALGYTILEWSDFTTEFTKADLKDGMVVEVDNGKKFLVLGDKFIGYSEWLSLSHYTDELSDGQWTVNKVYKTNPYAIYNIFESKHLTLIWERKEKPKPVEMTLEEVCKALGKEIKIVKG